MRCIRADKTTVDDAKKYLSDKEHGDFILAMGKAVDTYLEKGIKYLTDLRTLDYSWWLETIQKRKKKEAQILEATRAATEYNHCINQEIVGPGCICQQIVSNVKSWTGTCSTS